ncbi:MAG: signal peptidase I, partial [Gordonia sp.]|nr:signal peptidase I [Gordonia sp. (in: high G+C Gram-positive bacteria)]
MSQQEVQPQRRSRRELALNVGAVLGLMCIVAAIASMLFGITPLVFRSGSMSPEIPTGSLAIARTVDAQDLRVGDVV